jgi:hypothetical protein
VCSTPKLTQCKKSNTLHPGKCALTTQTSGQAALFKLNFHSPVTPAIELQPVLVAQEILCDIPHLKRTAHTVCSTPKLTQCKKSQALHPNQSTLATQTSGQAALFTVNLHSPVTPALGTSACTCRAGSCARWRSRCQCRPPACCTQPAACSSSSSSSRLTVNVHCQLDAVKQQHSIAAAAPAGAISLSMSTASLLHSTSRLC